ncbi:MAG: GGDEF domain-containing protein [Candidatus Izimaplasma sp.]|nr:GGDEF domain-containing protein [Candidatus Izimaplasma bacterium]
MIQAIIVYEVLIINLLLTHLILKRKYDTYVIVIALLTFTIAFSIIVKLTIPSEVSRAWTMLLGVIYIIPLSLLYKDALLKKVIVMTLCWSYSLFLSSIAYIITTSIYGTHLEPLMIILQTIFIVLTIPFLLPYIHKFLIFVLHNLDKKSNVVLIIMGVVNFSGLMAARYFIPYTNPILFLVIVISFGLTTILVNVLLYDSIQKTKRVKTLHNIAYKDFLTGVKNRHSLFLDAGLLIQEERQFQLIFMDLDNLKKINDEFSHQIGDEYLKTFVARVIKAIGSRGTLYRMSGDEFICIIHKAYSDEELALFVESIHYRASEVTQFNGVSIGSVLFPKDAITIDELIHKADNLMYKDKRSKPRKYRESN